LNGACFICRRGGEAVVFRTRLSRLVGIASSVLFLASCQSVGPIAIDAGRDRYNSIIQSTSKEQTLSNIIRVFNHEPTSFMDVSEVDATTSFSGNVSGGLSNIGAIAGIKSTSAGTIAGRVGSVTGGVTYSEAPIIRYTPLLGQSLVAQLITPVTVDTFEYLYDSSWSVTPLLDLSTTYLTPDLNEFYPALNIVSELFDHEAAAFAATKSELTRPQAQPGGARTSRSPSGPLTLEVASKPASPGPDDALDIYLQPFHAHQPRSEIAEGQRVLQLWVRLLWLYSGSQPKFTPRDPARCAQIGLSTDPSVLRTWDTKLGSDHANVDLNEIRRCLPNLIELRTLPVPPERVRSANLSTGSPLLKTSSTLGILKAATERPHPKIAFISREVYDTIRSYSWNRDVDSLSFYTLLPETENPGDEPRPDASLDREVTTWIKQPGVNLFVYDPRKPISEDDYIRGNRRLGFMRRYILIVVGDQAPANAYVSHFSDGKWYYIAGDDEISQKNFDLVSLFLTMMAIPSAVPPIAPTIAVGGT